MIRIRPKSFTKSWQSLETDLDLRIKGTPIPLVRAGRADFMGQVSIQVRFRTTRVSVDGVLTRHGLPGIGRG